MSDASRKNAMKRNRRITQENIMNVTNTHQIDLSSQSPRNKPVVTAVDFTKRILRASHVSLIGGPFHHHVRSATYGDPYDEIPWKVRMGMSEPKERHGYGDNPFVCTYDTRVLMDNWVEERRDRNYIKYNGPRLSQYGHHYTTESMRAFKKPLCNKQKDVLLNIATFPIPPHPGYQPELNLETLRWSALKPDSCVVDETVAQCQKEMEREQRYYNATKHLQPEDNNDD